MCWARTVVMEGFARTDRAAWRFHGWGDRAYAFGHEQRVAALFLHSVFEPPGCL
jgi:hypothetical protein